MSSGPATRRSRCATIGFRLTLWAAGITMAVCLLLGGVLYAGIWFSLVREVDGFIEGEIHEFTAIVREHDYDLTEAQRSIRLELGQRARHDLDFRLLDEQGRVLLSSNPKLDTALHWRPPDRWGQDWGESRVETCDVAGQKHPIRVCSQRFSGPAGQVYIAQATYVLDRVTASLTIFRRICIIALLLAVLISMLGGRLIASRSLRPVKAMIAKAQRIDAQRLQERLEVSGAGDELDNLAYTVNSMLDRLQRYVERLQQFTADASHELRSPLAALRGNAEVALTRDRSVAELRQVIEESVEQYDRLGRIAEDLLFLARADTGNLPLVSERVRLDEAVSDVVDLYTPLAKDRGVDLVLGECHAVELEADSSRLRQLVGNLIDNAIKYIGDGSKVEVAIEPGDGLARIRVSDDGLGIPAEDLPRVFDRFYRVDRSRSGGRTAGAGLGLSICRTIAAAHGGSIELTAVEGHGTVATVTLPVNGGVRYKSVSAELGEPPGRR